MIQLDSESFHQKAQNEALFLALFIGEGETDNETAERLEAILADPIKGAWTRAQVRADQNKDLPACSDSRASSRPCC